MLDLFFVPFEVFLGMLKHDVSLHWCYGIVLPHPAVIKLVESRQVGLGVVRLIDLTGEVIEHMNNLVLLLVVLIVVLGLRVTEEPVNEARIVVFQEPLG